MQTSVGLRVDPKVVLSSYILQLTQGELETAIEAELADNPALERLQDDAEPITEEAILKTVAPHELKPSSDDFEFHRSLPNDEERADWTDFATQATTLDEHLRSQLLPSLPSNLRSLGEYVVGCVNDRGYLTSPVEEIALMTSRPMEEVEAVVAELRRCEPSGVGATNVRECLLLQLRHADTIEKRLARAILKSHMEDLMARRTSRIMRQYRVLPEVVEAAFEEILRLTPYPGEAFTPANHGVTASQRRVAVVPDLILSLDETGWTVEVVGPDPVSFNIHRSYLQRYERLAVSKDSGDEKRHITQYVNRATTFIQGLQQRRKTLQRIGEHLVAKQPGFVSTGKYEFLQPMTRTQMAKALGMHESTVSRATTGKFVQIGNGEMVAFDIFFKPALRVQKMIEEILENENPHNPLSDDAIAQILKRKGVEVARRTVNKYRDKGRLLSSRKRRSA